MEKDVHSFHWLIRQSLRDGASLSDEKERQIMAWVKGRAVGYVEESGRIIAEARDLQVMDTLKPTNEEEAEAVGMNLEACAQIQRRAPGPFDFIAHFGGATAMLVPFNALTLLDDRRMRRLYLKYFGPLANGEEPRFPENVAIMHVRNTGAPARQNDAEPSGGMAATVNLLAEQVSEMVEMGVFKNGGWARFLLPKQLAEHQDAFDREQRKVWQIVMPELGGQPWCEVQLELLPVGRDIFCGQNGVLTVGPVVDFSLTCVAKLKLGSIDWKFRDLETHNDKPMRRKMVAIAPRQGRSPVVFALNSEGALDDFGHHFVLDGENRKLAITHIGEAVLQALGWIE